MPKCPIGFGSISFEYIYIFGTAFANFMEDYLLSLDDIMDTTRNIFGIEVILSIKKHKLISHLYKYLGYTIFGYIFFYISLRKRQNKEKQKNIETTGRSQGETTKSLIVKKNNISQKSKFLIIIACFIYSLQSLIRKIIQLFKVGELDLWIFNVFFITLFMNYYLGSRIYKHQKYSLLFIFVTNIILLFICSFIPKEKKVNEPSTIIEEIGYLSILVYLIYIILSCASSFSKVLSKNLMDLKYISPYHLIFIMGIFGVILHVITLIFTSCISCIFSGDERPKQCRIENNKNYYMESVPIYFSNMKNQINDNPTFFYVETLIVYPCFLFIGFIQFAFEMLLITYLNPNYKLISDCLYFAIKKLIEYNRKNEEKYNPVKFTIEYIAEILAILGYMIYLEIIELRFCGLDNDIKKKIMDRSFRESNIKALDNTYPINENNDNDSDDEIEEKETNENIEMENK